ncbi:MAG: MFS transporter [Gemmataceae bacterium]|nr:MFS transporter [Gemmataceae bacterium]
MHPPIQRPSRARYAVLALACSLSLITYLDRVAIMRARTDFETHLGFSEEAMSLVFTAFTIGYALFEVPAGWMGDRWGARAVLTRIVLMWSLFTALTGAVWPFALGPLDALGLMILIRFLFGAGEAGAYPNLARVAGDWFPASERGFAQGSIWTAARLGGAVAPLVLGRLSALVGWRGAFWVLGGIGVAWAAVFAWWFRDKPAQHPSVNEAERAVIEEGKRPHQAGHAWPGWPTLLGSVSVVALCWASCWVCFGWYFYITWQPKYLEQVFGLDPKGVEIEIATGLPFLFGAAGCFLGGRISDSLSRRIGLRWGRSGVGLAGFLGAGACVLAAGWASHPWAAVGLLCAAFLINDLAVPVMWAASSDMGGRYAGSLAGLMNSVGAVGAILSPLLIPRMIGWLPQDWSHAERWRVIFVGLAGAWLLAAAAWPFVDASRRIEPSQAPAS